MPNRTPNSAPPARKYAHATATVMSAAGASSDAPAPTQDPLLLQIPDSSIRLAPADGPVSPGLPMPILKSRQLSSLLLRVLLLCLGPAR